MPIDPSSLPQLQPPPWLTNSRTPVGPPIPATPNSRRYPAPSDQDPLTIFRPMINVCTVSAPRWANVGSDGLATVLIFTDGAAINNGHPNARAGCGIVFVPASPRPKGVSFHLEADDGPPTSNRAELLAVINALMLRVWIVEGFARITIATDSEYVVRGICEYVFSWMQRGRKTSQGKPVANRDLWECLLSVVERWERSGVTVSTRKLTSSQWKQQQPTGGFTVALLFFFLNVNPHEGRIDARKWFKYSLMYFPTVPPLARHPFLVLSIEPDVK